MSMNFEELEKFIQHLTPQQKKCPAWFVTEQNGERAAFEISGSVSACPRVKIWSDQRGEYVFLDRCEPYLFKS